MDTPTTQSNSRKKLDYQNKFDKNFQAKVPYLAVVDNSVPWASAP